MAIAEAAAAWDDFTFAVKVTAANALTSIRDPFGEARYEAEQLAAALELASGEATTADQKYRDQAAALGVSAEAALEAARANQILAASHIQAAEGAVLQAQAEAAVLSARGQEHLDFRQGFDSPSTTGHFTDGYSRHFAGRAAGQRCI